MDICSIYLLSHPEAYCLLSSNIVLLPFYHLSCYCSTEYYDKMFDKITHHFIAAIFNRVVIGFTLCSPGIGVEPQQVENLRFRQWRNRRFWAFVATNALLSHYLVPTLGLATYGLRSSHQIKLSHLIPYQFLSKSTASIATSCVFPAAS